LKLLIEKHRPTLLTDESVEWAVAVAAALPHRRVAG
jgi:hypothetical protein